MKDTLLVESINRIENSITESNSQYSYRDYVIASMVMKGFKINDCFRIMRKHILMLDVHDMNKSIALKNNLQLFDIEKLNDNNNLAYVMKNMETDEPLSILNCEVKAVLETSKELVDEIVHTVGYSEILEEEKGESIEMFFDEETRNNVHDIIENSFNMFRFYFSVDLLFTRNDGSQFIFNAELAGTQEEIGTGFAGRPVMPDDAGMWYEFGKAIQVGFVTKNVCRGLSVAYITDAGIISEIIDRKADDREPYYNPIPAKYILEVPKGWFKKNGIRGGDHVRMKTVIAPFS